ncbi:hypothetical protein BU23DRAFT_594897 [Bimuria novae-zelandiae CBS 107.79]|uniref:Uncharacterized protein n=1 Tax=Bimuria novae-zelandiae CBS 107.79 TaxID=1447943 RepID=A0A6A5VVE4_9PLEO|nr:hypothetical protein BU23DRAFT_594897 [Bimuria novae-zelandiae CBS 107.79]
MTLADIADPSFAYRTSDAEWTEPANKTFSDEERNPHWPQTDEIPLVNETSTRSSFTYNLTGLEFDQEDGEKRKRQSGKPLLRISLDGNNPDASSQGDYRQPLRKWLRFNGWDVNYIRSKANGNFTDNQNEGHPGYQIAAVKGAMNPVMNSQKPNLVLINAGTNDCTQADNPGLTPVDTGLPWVQKIPNRMREMIDQIYLESPGVTIILSTLLPNFRPDNWGPYVQVANQGFRQLGTEYTDKREKMIQDDGLRLADAFQKVVDAGFLVEPIDTGLGDGGSDDVCLPSSGTFGSAINSVRGETGYNDGTYTHSYHNKSMLGYHQIHFAQLVNHDDGDFPRDEFIMIMDPADRAYAKSSGGGSTFTNYMHDDWTPVNIVGQGTPEFLSRGVRFGDVNGDGLDDFICINREGSLFVSLNRDGSPPKLEYVGQIYSDRFPQGSVRLGDVDGDGRLDFCGMETSGYFSCWRNGSFYCGVTPRLSGDDSMSRDNILFGRVFGSGRADYIRIFETKIHIEELRVCILAVQEHGCGWRDGIQFCDTRGIGVDDMIFICGGGMADWYARTDNNGAPAWYVPDHLFELAVDRKFVHFADWNGDGRCDILHVDRGTGGVILYQNDRFQDDINPHIQPGQTVVSGAKCPQGYSPGLTDLAVHFADLDGDGRADYVCMNPDGRPVGWLNKPGSLTALNRIKVSVGFDRTNHRFADVDGDGRDDFIRIDKHTGNVQFWRNNGLIPSIGSSMNWIGYLNSWIPGKERGQNIRFPRMKQGSKRVNYHIVKPRTGTGITYYNSNCGDSGVGAGPDDGAGPTDPQLPTNPNGGGGGNNPCPICPRATKCGSWPDYPDFIALGDSYGAETRISTSSLVLATCMDRSPRLQRRPRQAPVGFVSEISNENYTVMSLFIGENDLDFADIAIWCLMVPNPLAKCENLINFAEKSVASGQYTGYDQTPEYQDFYKKLLETYRQVLWMPATADNWLFIYGYAMNNMIQKAIGQMRTEFPRSKSASSMLINSPKEIAGVTRKKTEASGASIYLTRSCPRTPTSLWIRATSWYCALREIHDNYGFDCDNYPEICPGGLSPRIGEQQAYDLKKAFHPKRIIYIKAAEYIQLNYRD